MQKKSINKKLWLEEGFILQSSRQEYWFGQGPFSYSVKPKPQSLYHPDFFLNNKKPWLKPSLVWKINKKGLSSFLLNSFCSSNSTDLNRVFKNAEKPSFIGYQEIFFQAQQAIHKGLFQKVVPAFSENFSLKPNVLFLLKNLFKKTHQMPHGFLYGMWNKKSGILGFTPEILFSIKEDQFSTMALAGTSYHLGPSLMKDKKELREHELVIQSLQESLEDVVNWNKKATCEILFPPLKHLHTELKGQLTQKFDFEKICKALHPTAALGGYPKKQTFDWLKNQVSQKHRNFFGAPFGFFNSDREAFCLVALRALEWNEEKSMIFSGGGLLKESLLQKEWKELFLKREQVKDFFS